MHRLFRSLAVWSLCTLQWGCGQTDISTPEEPLSSKLEPAVATLFNQDVGVIAGSAGCPSSAPALWMHMDNEDSRAASYLRDWVGSTQLDEARNTTFRFCRVDGAKFKPLETHPTTRSAYAVLMLGEICPPGSWYFSRFFDNEDRDNRNANSGGIQPNGNAAGDTIMFFCLFHGGGNPSTPAPSLPDLGFEYGVFAAQSFTFGTAKGQIFTDDEDTRNTNSYSVWSEYRHLALTMVSEGENTYMHVARAGAISCGDNVCNGFESELTCPADCTRCGDASCGPLENPTSCPYDCGSCGDGVCGYNEEIFSCPADCDICGNGICGPTETPSDCSADCG
ncbi:hypothetical protein [Myxococcus sp. CA040A]|uniref:hypothetical protein n=1 Tax=Myxococcus sp. CA040A TaxID=2741738 RepID=UPI00157B7AE9|nr:hypothetical protein [Myxococcus sp. CA040A]NTX01967.1 hypothetical protein [Myxococcus sp. CA040A]